MRERVGLGDAAAEASYPSPFRYGKQALLYVATDLPDPRRDNFALPPRRRAWPSSAPSRAAAPSSSSRASRTCASPRPTCAPRRSSGCSSRAQKPRHLLLAELREKIGSVLLATQSFWEGVDVPGEALSLVVIDKIPFDVPDDPLTAARIDHLREAGGEPFRAFQIPRAALSLKQGFGRLIRGHGDFGIVAMLDGRLLQKPYGRDLLATLPRRLPAHRVPRGRRPLLGARPRRVGRSRARRARGARPASPAARRRRALVIAVLLCVVAYVAGSIPFGLVIARGKGVDLRAVGSGNIGATNVARALGKGWAIAVLLLDAAKGFVPVMLGKRLGLPPEHVALAGLAAIVGHMFTIFLRGRGGKGVATSLGVALALSPLAALCGFGLYVVAYLLLRLSSVGSLLGIWSFPLFATLLGGLPRPYLALATVAAVLVTIRHRAEHRAASSAAKRKGLARRDVHAGAARTRPAALPSSHGDLSELLSARASPPRVAARARPRSAADAQRLTARPSSAPSRSPCGTSRTASPPCRRSIERQRAADSRVAERPRTAALRRRLLPRAAPPSAFTLGARWRTPRAFAGTAVVRRRPEPRRPAAHPRLSEHVDPRAAARAERLFAVPPTTARASADAHRPFARAPQRHARAARARDEAALVVEDVALDEAHGAPALDDLALGAQVRPPHGLHEVDLELERREALAARELRRVGDPHRRVGQIAQHAAVESPHRVGEPLVDVELHRGVPRRERRHRPAEDPGDRCVQLRQILHRALQDVVHVLGHGPKCVSRDAGPQPPRGTVDNMTMSGHNEVMKSVQIAQLKSRLSQHLREVRAGETLTVLDRDTPIARIVPIDSEDDVVITKPARGAPAPNKLRFPRLPKLGVDVVALLLEDRTAALMTAYVDASVILRKVLSQARPLPEWRLIRGGPVSRLAEVECLRTLDRMRVDGLLDDRDVSSAREALYRTLASFEIVEVSRTILSRAAQPTPTALGTLDAIHLCSAILWRERSGTSPVFATHDHSLAVAARSQGFRVVGA